MKPESPKSLESSLFHGLGIPADDSARASLLEQYKLFVGTSEALVARRQTVNAFFLSLNTLILGGIGLFVKEGFTTWYSATAMLSLGTAGTALSYLWRRLIRSYQQLNTGKFQVIGQLERALPAAVFESEWLVLGEGRDPKLYTSSTRTEKAISTVFLTIYVLIATAGVLLGLWLLRMHLVSWID